MGQTASSVQRLHKAASKNLPSNRRWPQNASYDKNEHKKTRSLLKPQIFVFGFYQDKMAINYCITTVQTKPCFTSCAAGNHKNTAGQNQPKKSRENTMCVIYGSAPWWSPAETSPTTGPYIQY